MRINIYGDDLASSRSALVAKEVECDGVKRTAYGVRLYLDCDAGGEDEDNPNAVTLWCPWTRRAGNDVAALRNALIGMANLVDGIPDGHG